MIKYLAGDATRPEEAGKKIIAHISNDIGKWGKGFVLAISKRWKAPEVMYRGWHAGARRMSESEFGLGEIQLVRVEDDTLVANMIAQSGIYTKNGIPPIRYDALRACLEKLSTKANEISASVHMPRIGAGLAGGKWHTIEKIINETLIKNGVSVFVYDLKKLGDND